VIPNLTMHIYIQDELKVSVHLSEGGNVLE
jgi:hypothetical protein